ncbi:MAG: hypothetical protein Q9191_007190 [Dirinaria sp. TL-2023a]
MKASTFPYLTLPPEIRNKIMRYALVPGKIYLHNPHHRPRRANISPPQSPPISAFQLLGTCKQIYREGITLFYSENTFFLAPGLLKYTSFFFNSVILTNHRSMIRHLGLRLSLEDCPEDIIHPQIHNPKFAIRIPPFPDINTEFWLTWTEKARMLLAWYRVQVEAGNGDAATLHVEGLLFATGSCPDPFLAEEFEKVGDRAGYLKAMLFGEIRRSLGVAWRTLSVGSPPPRLIG